MLRSLRSLEGYRIRASDGDVGGVRDLLFDDASWRVRYMVASGGSWLSGRKVLLAISASECPTAIPVSATIAQIRTSPGLDSHPPVSRQHELDLHTHYKWLPYWSTAPSKDTSGRRDPNLRSVHEVAGYHVDAKDGAIGQVEDFIVDDADWTIRYVVVDTRKILTGGNVLVPPDWLEGFDWTKRKAIAKVTREKIKGSPKFDPTEAVNRKFEERLYDYYGQPRYWAR